MKELIKSFVAKKLGFVTEEQHLHLLKKQLNAAAGRHKNNAKILERERLSLFKQCYELTQQVAELHEVMAHQGVRYPGISRDKVEEVTSFSEPTAITLGT